MTSLVFRQLFEKESCTYTYVLGDMDTKEAIVIDPVDVCADRDALVIEEMGLKLKYACNTHVHAGTGHYAQIAIMNISIRSYNWNWIVKEEDIWCQKRY